ncbi:MAG: Spy/CpxP family protein refolding chaperone [Planctomycetes bacterium]|nr:Spy/CpxP family protein refolding chaperone [Planctomycetota bacterium]
MRRILAITSGVWLLLIVSLAFNVGFGSTLAVQKVRQMCGGKCGGPGMGPALCQSHLFDSIDLSPEQNQRFTAAQEALMADVAALRNELMFERTKLGELLTADTPDQDAIQAQLDRISALQRHVQERVVTHLLSQRQQLTSEQKAEYDELVRQRICPCGGAGTETPCESHGGRRGSGDCPMEP